MTKDLTLHMLDCKIFAEDHRTQLQINAIQATQVQLQ
jgi:hypothetical protein